jgi:hypothetical protein
MNPNASNHDSNTGRDFEELEPNRMALDGFKRVPFLDTRQYCKKTNPKKILKTK